MGKGRGAAAERAEMCAQKRKGKGRKREGRGRTPFAFWQFKCKFIISAREGLRSVGWLGAVVQGTCGGPFLNELYEPPAQLLHELYATVELDLSQCDARHFCDR